MSLNNFIPTLWADTLLPALRANLVYANLFNEDYQGTIERMGDSVLLTREAIDWHRGPQVQGQQSKV